MFIDVSGGGDFCGLPQRKLLPIQFLIIRDLVLLGVQCPRGIVGEKAAKKRVRGVFQQVTGC